MKPSCLMQLIDITAMVLISTNLKCAFELKSSAVRRRNRWAYLDITNVNYIKCASVRRVKVRIERKLNLMSKKIF